jgi:hypothetical protein
MPDMKAVNAFCSIPFKAKLCGPVDNCLIIIYTRGTDFSNSIVYKKKRKNRKEGKERKK